MTSGAAPRVWLSADGCLADAHGGQHNRCRRPAKTSRTFARSIDIELRTCVLAGEITKLAIERRLLKCMGKTPENTMASALYTEVRKKAATTVFIK